MSLNLTIDQGNTATKAVIYDGTHEVDAATLRGPGLAAQLSRFVADRAIDAAIAASVADGVAPLLHEVIHAPLKMELTAATPVPLTNGYATPATLGVDRMAAAVGARSLFPDAEEELLVCDLGTACTFDVVTPDGRFLGGNIAPGVGMRLRGLHRFTSRLPQVSGHVQPIDLFGTDTEGAMRAGAIRGVVAEILYYRLAGCDPQHPRRVLLTGGWAPEIADLLPQEIASLPTVTIHPHLVNQGLNSILLYNHK